MKNGHDKDENTLILPPKIDKSPALTCHRFFAPIVIPEPDKLDTRKLNIMPRMGNFPCIKEKCTLWNEEAQECYEKTSAKALATIAQFAFNKMNDVHTDVGGGL